MMNTLEYAQVSKIFHVREALMTRNSSILKLLISDVNKRKINYVFSTNYSNYDKYIQFIQYIGETKRRLKERFNKHRRSVDKLNIKYN